MEQTVQTHTHRTHRGMLECALTVSRSLSGKFVRWNFVLGTLALLAFSNSETLAQQRKPQFVKDRPFRESASLPTDSNLLKRFGTVEGLLSDRRWVEAIAILQEIAQNEGHSLVLVEPGLPGGAATYTNVATRCNVLLSHIPDEGRAAYRQRMDPQAKRWFEHWTQTRDQSHLLKIVRQAFLSSYGDDALLALGEVAWDREDYSLARQWWEQMLPLDPAADPARYPTVLRYPDAALDRPQILARLILCSILSRETHRAESELRQFEGQHAGAGGWLAGRQGRLAEILRETLSESKSWNQGSSSGEASTFAMSPQRSSSVPNSLDVGALRWSQPLSSRVTLTPSARQPIPPVPLSYHPVVYGTSSDQIVFVNDADCIRAWNLYTGEPAWASAGRDPSMIYPAIVDSLPLRIDRDSVGVPNYTMSIAGDRLYARMGTPVTSSSSSELRRDPNSDLICLDLKQEGRLVWKISAQELMRDDGSWQFEGTPVVVQGRAYVALCRRHPQLELMVVCLDASDGRAQWQKSVGGFRSVVEESKNRISHLLLTYGGGKVFLSTDAGAVLALDAFDGRLEWAISYESRSVDLTATRTELYTSAVRPCLYHAGLVFAAPTDSNVAFCIEADSGRLQWLFPFTERVSPQLNETTRRSRETEQVRNREWRHLLGVVPGGANGRLVVSGRGLWWIDVETGRISRVRNDGNTAGMGKENFGRGVISGDQILVPTRETIEYFHAQTGDATRSVLLKTPDVDQQGGNLVVADDMLLVAQTNRLSAYGEFSLLKERLEKRLIQRPSDRNLLLRLAELEASDGKVMEAIDRIRAILPQSESESNELQPLKSKLAQLTRKAGKAAFDASKFDEARGLWNESLELMTDPVAMVELIFDLTNLDERLGQPEAAAEHLQKVLQDARLRHVIRDMRSAGAAAQGDIRRLIAQSGRSVYGKIDAQAEALFQKSANSPQDLRQLISAFPNALVCDKARTRIAELNRESGDRLELCHVLDEIRRQDPKNLDHDLAFVAETEKAGATNVARRLWQSLASTEPTVSAEFEGKSVPVSRLATERLAALESRATAKSSFVERTWSYRLPTDVRVTVPRGPAPSSEKSVVLISYRLRPNEDSWSWKCLDWRTGNLRWQSTEGRQIEFAVWSPYRLLIATDHGWQARTADQGRVAWSYDEPVLVRPLVVNEPDSSIEIVASPGVFAPDRGLTFLDPSDGSIVATVKPPGQVHDKFVVGHVANMFVPRTNTGPASSERGVSAASRIVVAVQTLNPTRYWLLHANSPKDHWTLKSELHGGEPWATDPFIVRDEVVGLTQDHRLLGYKLNVGVDLVDQADVTSHRDRLRRGDFWFDNNFPTAFGPPVIFATEQGLFTLSDGSRLSSVELGSGRRKWTSSLAHLPINNARSQICRNGTTVTAVSQGALKSISLNDGTPIGQSFLGDTSVQWKTASISAPHRQREGSSFVDDRRPWIAAWPTPLEGQRHSSIWLVDAVGDVSQQLRVEGEPQGIVIDDEGHGLVWTDALVTGLEFAATSEIE